MSTDGTPDTTAPDWPWFLIAVMTETGKKIHALHIGPVGPHQEWQMERTLCRFVATDKTVPASRPGEVCLTCAVEVAKRIENGHDLWWDFERTA